MFNQMKQLEARGVKLKIAVNAPQPYIADTDELVATGTYSRMSIAHLHEALRDA